MKTGYVIITPAKDEEKFIEKTIQSVLAQNIRPLEWVIVNDGSTDKTAQIVKSYLAQHSWIHLLSLPVRDERKVGGGVAAAFNKGLDYLRTRDYDFICKLDADLSLPGNYFEFLLLQFHQNPRLGIASGCTFVPWGGKLIWERNYEKNTRGAMKVYRKECFESIGGLMEKLGWDVIDDFTAQAAGWQTQSFRSLAVIHHRPMGTSGPGGIAGKVRWGHLQYLLNYDPLFAFLAGAYRMIERPYLIGGLAMWYGYVSSFFKKEPRIAQGDIKNLIRKSQRKRLWQRLTGLPRGGLGLTRWLFHR